jgi:hypothetical protein
VLLYTTFSSLLAFPKCILMSQSKKAQHNNIDALAPLGGWENYIFRVIQEKED